MRRFARGLAIAPLLGMGAQAAPPPPPAVPAGPPGAVFRSEVSYIQVDVAVTDAQGGAVRGLTRGDFEVWEEGARQEIATFSEIAIPIDAGEPAARPRPLRDVATNEDGGPGRIYALVLDEANTDARRSELVKKAAGAFIDRHLGATDIAAVVYAGGGTEAAPTFTSDKRVLQEALSRFAGRKPPSATLERARAIERQRDLLQSPRDPAEVAAFPYFGTDTDAWDTVRAQNARTAMAALESIARALQGIRGRRKAVLFFSEGVDYDTLNVMGRRQRNAADVSFRMRSVIAAAARSTVSIHAIDPRGLARAGQEDMESAAPPGERSFGLDAQSIERERRRSQDSLRTLAEQTGGAAVVDTNDFSAEYARIVRASSHYYLLGYYPPDFRPDGAFRRIEVRVARPGVSVVARKGYVRSGPEEAGTRPERAAATGTSPEVRELLHAPWPQPGLTLGVTAAVFRVTPKTATVAVTIQVPARAAAADGAERAGEVEVSLIAVDAAGRVRAGDRVLVTPASNAQAPDRGPERGMRLVRRLELPPGTYQLRVAAREGEGGPRGSVFQDFHVPDYAGETLVMSGVLLTSRTAALTPTPSFDAVVKGLLATPPTTARTFGPDDVLTAYAEVYDTLPAEHQLALTTRVTGADGREVLRATHARASPELQAAGGGFRHELDIPLARVGPGTYVLRIEASPSVGQQTVARELSFEVLPAAAGGGASDITGPPAAVGLQGWAARRPTSRIGRLEAWLAAVEAHDPGTGDGPALMVRTWAPEDLVELADDVTQVAALITDPGHHLTWRIDPARSGRPQRSPYSTADDERLRILARVAANGCVGSGVPEPSSVQRTAAGHACARNRILKRGAILHTDAAIRFGDPAAPPSARGQRPERWMVRFSDGQQDGTAGAPLHWEVAQAMLGLVLPDPRKDETVRLWYVAVAAWSQVSEQHTRFEDRAAQLFPKDPQVLFLAATLHETFASPRIQSLARSLRVPAGSAHAIGTERGELRRAEELFRRALEVDPALTEARVRLGRVLHRLGRHQPAVVELQRAVADLSSVRATAGDDDGVLAYHAEMFLGAASEALGRRDRARASYGRAAALYPTAPSPRLALSRLALFDRDRAEGLGALQQVLRPPADGERDDPWWGYHLIQGRGATASFDALRRSLGEP